MVFQILLTERARTGGLGWEGATAAGEGGAEKSLRREREREREQRELFLSRKPLFCEYKRVVYVSKLHS